MFEVKVTGLDRLQKQLEDAQKALAGLEGELGSVSFNPSDPAGIEAAIQQIEMTIDGRIGHYASNPIIAPFVEQMKERYRAQIIERAAAARLKGNDQQ